MKKILTTILIISALLTLSINCFATETTYTLDFSQYEQYKNELAEIVSLIEKRPQDFDYFTDMEIEKLEDLFTEETLVYPVFHSETKITSADAFDFDSIIPKEHSWNIKTRGNTLYFEKVDGKWKEDGAGIDPDYTDADFIDYTPSGLKALFKEKTGIQNFDDAKLITLGLDYGKTDYAYARAGEDEYLMALEDMGLLKKGEVYTAEQAVYICLAEMKIRSEELAKFNGEVVAGGSGMFTSPEDFDFSKIDLNELKTGNITFELKEEKPQNNTVWVILALVLTAALVAAAVVLGFKKKKA